MEKDEKKKEKCKQKEEYLEPEFRLSDPTSSSFYTDIVPNYRYSAFGADGWADLSSDC